MCAKFLRTQSLNQLPQDRIQLQSLTKPCKQNVNEQLRAEVEYLENQCIQRENQIDLELTLNFFAFKTCHTMPYIFGS